MSYKTEEYYDLLELAPSATQEEIKSQYKQLVRLYHPDRFLESSEKSAAEERLKSINEAYRVLSSRAIEGQLVRYMQKELGLTVEPSLLDFGLMERRQQQNATFYVRFEKEVEAVDFVLSEEDGWFHVARVSHIYGAESASLEFEVEVDSTGLGAGTYQGWIDIYLDTTMMRVPLTMQVAQSRWLWISRVDRLLTWPRLSRQWALGLTFVLALLGFTVALTLMSSGSFTQPQLAVAGASVAGTSPHQLYFALSDQGESALYSASAESAALPLQLTAGTQAAVSARTQNIAFLAMQAEQPQIFLRTGTAGATIQLTDDDLLKSRPAWSSDGEQLAYLVGDNQEAHIGIYDLHTQAEYRLPGAVTTGVSNFVWSPTDSLLLFDLWQNGERRVYRMSVPDGELEQLTQFDSWAGTWSPDGSEIIVASAQGLFRLASSGRNLRQISNVAAEQPQWSADGEWLAYTTAPLLRADADSPEPQAQAAHTLWLMHLDESTLQQISINSLWHAWAPDGTQLGYVTGSNQQPANGEPALYYLWALSPGEEAVLVAEVNQPFFTWSQ